MNVVLIAAKWFARGGGEACRRADEKMKRLAAAEHDDDE
jgi:hypothetical protein